MTLIWGRRRGIAGFTAAGIVIGVAVALLWPPTYPAVASFVPEQTAGARLQGSLGGLASQLGVPLGQDGSQSPRFYADVLLSRQVAERVLLSRFPRAAVGDSVALIDQLEIDDEDPNRRLAKAVRRLRTMCEADADIRTGIVRLTVRMRDPALAAAVANRFVDAVNEFNTGSRQSQAARRRRFIEIQADSAERELQTAEDRLKRFYEQNRSWAQSPELQYRLGQLQRQVEIEKDVFLTLRRNLETARIDEVNDVPVINVIDRATPPVERLPRRRLVVLGGLAIGLLGGVAYAYLAWSWPVVRGWLSTTART